MKAKEPCISCPETVVDEWGYLCDLACGKRSTWLNYMVGIKEVVEWIETHTLISPDKDSLTQFEPFYQIERTELREWRK